MRKLKWDGEWLTNDEVVRALARKGYGAAAIDKKFLLVGPEGELHEFNNSEELNNFLPLILTEEDITNELTNVREGN